MGTFLRRKIIEKAIEKRGAVLNVIFGPLDAFWGSFGIVFESLLDVFWLPNRAVHRIAKTTKSDDVTALSNGFSGAGG